MCGGGRASLDPYAAAEMVISALASLDCLAIVFVQFFQLRFETLLFLTPLFADFEPRLEIWRL